MPQGNRAGNRSLEPLTGDMRRGGSNLEHSWGQPRLLTPHSTSDTLLVAPCTFLPNCLPVSLATPLPPPCFLSSRRQTWLWLHSPSQLSGKRSSTSPNPS